MSGARPSGRAETARPCTVARVMINRTERSDQALGSDAPEPVDGKEAVITIGGNTPLNFQVKYNGVRVKTDRNGVSVKLIVLALAKTERPSQGGPFLVFGSGGRIALAASRLS